MNGYSFLCYTFNYTFNQKLTLNFTVYTFCMVSLLVLLAVLIIAKLIVKKMHSRTLHRVVTVDFKEDQLDHPFNEAGHQASTRGAECPLV